MNARLWNSTLIKVVVLAALLGCSTPANPPPPTITAAPTAAPTEATSAAIVMDMVDRLNAGDVEGSLAYFADDATGYLMGLPPTGIEIWKGKDQFRQVWEDSVANHFQWEVAITDTHGHEVHLKSKTWHDFTRQLGVAPLEYVDIYEIKDGKILTYGSWLTEESLNRFKPAFAEAMPPEPAATPPSAPPVSDMAVTIAGGTCTTDDLITLQAGEVTATLDVKDLDHSLYALTVFNLDTGKDFLDLMATTIGSPPDWADILLFEELGPGSKGTYTFAVEKGPVYLICWSQPPVMPIGNAGPFAVAP
jgi:ketosteroid isomerase-like protein